MQRLLDRTGKARPFFSVIADSVQAFLQSHGTIRAAALTYTTLLAVVPFVILLTSISVLLGIADALTDYLPAIDKTFKLHLPLEQILPILENAQSIKFGHLGVIGSLGLFVTFLLAIDNIESNMNVIWHVPKNRSLVRKAIIYIPFLLLGVAAIGFLTGLLAIFRHLLSYLAGLETFILGSDYTGILVEGGVTLFLNLVAFSLLYAIYRFIPYTKVQRRPALLATLSAWVGMYVFVGALIFLQASLFAKMSLFYGSLAFIPLVMLLIFGIWCIVLYGNALCWRIQTGGNKIIPSTKQQLHPHKRHHRH